MTITAVTGPSQGHGLLRGTELVSVGLLAARSAAAARRVCNQGQLDEIDRNALDALRRLLVASADTVTYFGSAGERGERPSKALAATLEATIGAVMPGVTPSDDAERLATVLREAANLMERFLAAPSSELAPEVRALSSSLATATNRVGGHTGERTSTL